MSWAAVVSHFMRTLNVYWQPGTKLVNSQSVSLVPSQSGLCSLPATPLHSGVTAISAFVLVPAAKAVVNVKVKDVAATVPSL